MKKLDSIKPKNLLAYIKKRPEILVFIFFTAAALSLAFVVNPGVPPDESVHYHTIEYYSHNTLSPQLSEQTGSFYLGEVTRDPSFLYYYVLSFFFRLFTYMNINTYAAIRVINVLLGLTTLILLAKLADELNISKSIKFSLLFLVANIPMFLVLSSGVNNDNAVLVLSTLGILLSIKLLRRPNAIKLLGFAIVSLSGVLVKYTFLPIAAVFLLVFIYVLAKNYKRLLKDISKLNQKQKNYFAVLCVAIIALSVLFTAKYIRNIIEYHDFSPKCDIVLTTKQCNDNFVFKRNGIYSAANLKAPTINIGIYMTNWVRLMASRTFGILAHRSFTQQKFLINASITMFYIMLILFIRKFKFKDGPRNVIPLATLVYLLVLINTNIGTFKKTQEIDLAVQGRYWFPVIFAFIFYVASLYNKIIDRSKYINLSICVILILFSLGAGIPNLIHGMKGNEWIRSNIQVLLPKI